MFYAETGTEYDPDPRPAAWWLLTETVERMVHGVTRHRWSSHPTRDTGCNPDAPNRSGVPRITSLLEPVGRLRGVGELQDQSSELLGRPRIPSTGLTGRLWFAPRARRKALQESIKGMEEGCPGCFHTLVH
jgi:hypothetical protein